MDFITIRTSDRLFWLGRYKLAAKTPQLAVGSSQSLRVIPHTGVVQRCTTLIRETQPTNANWKITDAFGNHVVCGYDYTPTDLFNFHEWGTVVTGLADSEPVEPFEQLQKFRFGGHLITFGSALKTFDYTVIHPLMGSDSFLNAHIIMTQVYQYMTYTKGVTNVKTTSEEAAALKKGVCQDYAHVMIALCRMEGLTARYVTGFLIGEGESHAWVEVLVRDRWYGFDPTNNVHPTFRHIRVAVGRDADDCPMNRGIIYGKANQIVNVAVKVWEQ